MGTSWPPDTGWVRLPSFFSLRQLSWYAPGLLITFPIRDHNFFLFCIITALFLTPLPIVVLCLLLKIILRRPYLEIFHFENLFVSDAPIKWNQKIILPPPLSSETKGLRGHNKNKQINSPRHIFWLLYLFNFKDKLKKYTQQYEDYIKFLCVLNAFMWYE